MAFDFRKGEMYGNCLIMDPDGVKLARVAKNKVIWYLQNGLAELVSQEPYWEIKLSFYPSDEMTDVEDPYLTSAKESKCVVCGVIEDLTFHHVVPYCYRRYFPKEFKKHSSYDILILCEKHHAEYEVEANKFKIKIFQDFAVDQKVETPELITALNIGRMCKTLLSNWDAIPEFRREKLLTRIRLNLNLPSVQKEDLAQLSQMYALCNIWKTVDTRKPYRELVSKIKDLDQFCFMWRKHFIDILKPQHMSPLWNINKSIYKKVCIRSEPHGG